MQDRTSVWKHGCSLSFLSESALAPLWENRAESLLELLVGFGDDGSLDTTSRSELPHAVRSAARGRALLSEFSAAFLPVPWETSLGSRGEGGVNAEKC